MRSRRCSRSGWRSCGAGGTEARAAIPLALIAVAKLFLWPLAVWLIATGRFRIAWRAAVLAVGACALGVGRSIGFAGLGDYPQLLRVLAEGEQSRGYSLVAAGLALGLGPVAARAVAIAIGVGLLALCWREGRRGFDERSLALAFAAALAFTPILWPHYFVILLVPIALARRTFGPIWLIPALFWITPFQENFGADWRIFVGLAIAGAGALGREPSGVFARTRQYDPAL